MDETRNIDGLTERLSFVHNRLASSKKNILISYIVVILLLLWVYPHGVVPALLGVALLVAGAFYMYNRMCKKVAETQIYLVVAEIYKLNRK